MVKTRLQATGKGTSVSYSGPLDCVRKIVSTEGGVPALYRGLIPNLIGVTPEKAIKLVSLSFLINQADGASTLNGDMALLSSPLLS
jgi:hypothetical protein